MEGNDFILRENRKNNYNGIGIWFSLLSRLKETNTYIYLSTIKVTRPYQTRVLVISDVASNASNSRGVQYNVHCNASIIEIYKYTLLANYNKIMLHRAISRNKECTNVYNKRQKLSLLYLKAPILRKKKRNERNSNRLNSCIRTTLIDRPKKDVYATKRIVYRNLVI